MSWITLILPDSQASECPWWWWLNCILYLKTMFLLVVYFKIKCLIFCVSKIFNSAHTSIVWFWYLFFSNIIDVQIYPVSFYIFQFRRALLFSQTNILSTISRPKKLQHMYTTSFIMAVYLSLIFDILGLLSHDHMFVCHWRYFLQWNSTGALTNLWWLTG